MDWQSLLAGGESIEVEFKSDQGPLSDRDLVEAVVCLANCRGGTLFLGVEDDGTVTGLHPNHQTQPERMAALIANRTVPPLSSIVEFVHLSQGSGETWVAILSVPTASQPTATSDGRVLVRYLDTQGRPFCRPAYPTELASWLSDRGGIDMTARPIAGASRGDLDPLEIERVRRMVKAYRGDANLLDLDDEELCRALGLIDPDGTPTLAGLLLVGQESALSAHVPTHEIAFQVLRGTDVLVNEFYKWPLLRCVERILEGFQVRNEERELNIGLFRVGIPAYDPRGFREAMNNALVHRDYRRLGATHVQLYDDHILISNPGGFVEGVRPDNLLRVGPRPRNPLLADCFKRVGLVERTGRGVNIIYSGQLRNGRRPPSYERSTEANVTVVLRGGPADLQFVELILTRENQLGRMMTLSELLILDYVHLERDMDTSTAAQITQQSEAEARATLEGLVEIGLLQRRGERRARTYHFSASVYRELGEPAAYVRARGFETLQMENMIEQYVRAHGRITRREAAELCHVGENRARYILSKLVKSGRLRLMGRGRGAFYKLANVGESRNER